MTLILAFCLHAAWQTDNSNEYFPDPVGVFQYDGMSYQFLGNALKAAADHTPREAVREMYRAAEGGIAGGGAYFKQDALNWNVEAVGSLYGTAANTRAEERKRDLEERGFRVEVRELERGLFVIDHYTRQRPPLPGETEEKNRKWGTEFLGQGPDGDTLWFGTNAELVRYALNSGLPMLSAQRGDRVVTASLRPKNLPREFRRRFLQVQNSASALAAQPMDDEPADSAEYRETNSRALARWANVLLVETGTIDLLLRADPETLAWNSNATVIPDPESAFAETIRRATAQRSTLDPFPSTDQVGFIYLSLDAAVAGGGQEELGSALMLQLLSQLMGDIRPGISETDLLVDHRVEACLGAEVGQSEDLCLWGAVASPDTETIRIAADASLRKLGARRESEGEYFIPERRLYIALRNREDNGVVFVVGGNASGLVADQKLKTVFRSVSNPPLLHGYVDTTAFTELANSGGQFAGRPVRVAYAEQLLLKILQAGFRFPFRIADDPSADAERYLSPAGMTGGLLRVLCTAKSGKLQVESSLDDGGFSFLAKLYTGIMQRRRPVRPSLQPVP